MTPARAILLGAALAVLGIVVLALATLNFPPTVKGPVYTAPTVAVPVPPPHVASP